MEPARTTTASVVTNAAVLAIVPAVSIYEILYGPEFPINVAAAIVLAVSLFAIRKRYRTAYGDRDRVRNICFVEHLEARKGCF